MKKNLLLICLLFLFACKKENWGEGDGQLPAVMLTAPTHNQVFAAGETVAITASITDNQKIREVHLEIINTTTGAFITHEHFAPDGSVYTLNRTFVAQAAATYRIKVEAEDGAKNKAKAEVTIISN